MGIPRALIYGGLNLDQVLPDAGLSRLCIFSLILFSETENCKLSPQRQTALG